MLFVRPKDEILLKVHKLQSDSNFIRAGQTLESALEDYPDDFELLLELAKTKALAGKSREAAVLFKKALGLYPRRGEETITRAEEVRAQAPELIEIGQFLHEAYIGNRDLESAQKILESFENDALQDLTERYETIFRNLQDLDRQEARPDRQISVLYCIATTQLAQGHWTQAYDTLGKICDLEPQEQKRIHAEVDRLTKTHYGQGGPHVLLADLLVRARCITQAVSELTEATRREAGLAGEARQRLERLLEQEGQKAEILVALGDVHLLCKDAVRAREALDSALRADPSCVDLLLSRFRETLRLDARDPGIHLSLGDALAARKQFPSALAEYQRGLQIDPTLGEQVGQRLESLLDRHPGETTVVAALTELDLAYGRIDRALARIRAAADISAVSPLLSDRLADLLEQNPAQPRIVSTLALLLMDASRDRALLLFRFLANLGPESAQEAVTELFRLAESRPDDLELRITLGRVLLQIRGPEEALAQFESALREHGESATQVVPFLDQIVDRSPACAVRVFQLYTTLPAEVDGHSLVRLARLRALLTLQRWKEAREELRALDAGGEEEIVREAIRSVEAALRSAPEAGILRQALIELHLGREEYGDAAARLEELGQCGREWVPRAIELYRTALQTAPGALLLWESFLGTCCNHGMYAVAIIEAEKALAVLSPPEAGVVLRWLGTCYLEEGNLSQAVACIQDSVRRNEACAPAAEQELQRILAIDPSHAGCRLALGRLLLLRGEAKEAADHLREAIRFDPGSMAQVIEELKDASRRLTGETNIRLALGELLEARGDFEEALQVYEELLEQDSASVDLLRPRLEFACREAPRNARAHLLLGKACARTKDVASACRFLFHAATLDTRSSEAVLKELRTIEQIEPSSSEPKLYLAEVYFRKGLIDAGMELLGQAVRTDPSSGPRVRVRLEKLRERHAENAALQLGLAALGANSAG